MSMGAQLRVLPFTLKNFRSFTDPDDLASKCPTDGPFTQISTPQPTLVPNQSLRTTQSLAWEKYGIECISGLHVAVCLVNLIYSTL